MVLKDLSGVSSSWVKGSHMVLVGQGQFARWAHWAEVGLATAGTATEQLVGLGIPALSLPGPGPQFQRAFAIRQSRLLGGAVMPCFTTEALAERLQLLLLDPNLCVRMGQQGSRRMGCSGGSDALAELVLKKILRNS